MEKNSNQERMPQKDEANEFSEKLLNAQRRHPRRFFLRSVGLGTVGIALSKIGFSDNGMPVKKGASPLTAELRRYYAHTAVLDKHGVIAPWYSGLNGQVDFRLRVAAETLKRYPWTTPETAIAVYPDYLFTSKWKISAQGKITPVDPGDWMNGDLGQRSTSVLKGMVEYYRYSGDPAALAHMTYMADFVIDHSLTSETHHWPKFPISVPTKGKAYGKANEKGMIQLDICGSMAHGIIRAYQVTGNERWLEYAKHWGDVFAEKCNHDPAMPPWPRYAVPENTAPRWRTDPRANRQTGGVTMILGFLDELIRIGYNGKNGAIVKARDAGVSYLRNHLLPEWSKDDTWAYYFWDWLNFTQNCSTTADATSYMLNNKQLFPNWKNDVRNILMVFLNRTSASPDSNGDVYNGAWAYPESSHCCGRSLWYAPLMDGAVMAQYGVEAGDDLVREIAYRSIILQTYDGHANGVTEDNIDGGTIVNGEWLNIAHPWPLLWGLTSIGWLPEALGASRENHLVRTTAVVRSVNYRKGQVCYSTFDAPENTREVLRLSFEPTKVTANGKKLPRLSELNTNGYTVKKLPNNDAIVTVRHDGSTDILIYGNDAQEIVPQKDFLYEGNWKKLKEAAAYSGMINETETAGSSVTATFHGNQVRLIGKVDEWGGVADIYIDGEKQLAPVDCWSPTPRSQQTLYYKNGLSEGRHTLKIVARGDKSYYSRGKRIYVDTVQRSSEQTPFHFPSGTGPTDAQRMIFGYTKREDYKDTKGQLWRPATEIVTRAGYLEDTLAVCWWTKPAGPISGAQDPELYKYGYHAPEFWVNLTVGPAKYDLRLKFAASRGLDAKKNSFDIFINGNLAAGKMDIQSVAGTDKAYDMLFRDIHPVNGIIEVRFKAADKDNGEAFVQALEIAQQLL